MVFRIVPPSHRHSEVVDKYVYDRFLAYVRRYDIVNQPNPENASLRGFYPEPNTGLYLLKKSIRANGSWLGDVIPVDQIRALLDLTPRFGLKANRRLTYSSSVAYSTEFWLNKFFNKELYYALS